MFCSKWTSDHISPSISPRFLCRLTDFMDLLQPWDVRGLYMLICLSNSASAHFHVSWLSDFIFYQKPLYKSLHQSFFYSFITILPSERGVTLYYSTIFTAEESRTNHRCDIALRNTFLQNKSTIVHMDGTRKVNT